VSSQLPRYEPEEINEYEDDDVPYYEDDPIHYPSPTEDRQYEIPPQFNPPRYTGPGAIMFVLSRLGENSFSLKLPFPPSERPHPTQKSRGSMPNINPNSDSSDMKTLFDLLGRHCLLLIGDQIHVTHLVFVFAPSLSFVSFISFSVSREKNRYSPLSLSQPIYIVEYSSSECSMLCSLRALIRLIRNCRFVRFISHVFLCFRS
jgi:hypothetical protein